MREDKKKEYVLVSGASSGIGKDIAVNLSSEFSIILCGRDKKRLDIVKHACEGDDNLVWQCDLANTQNIETDLAAFLLKNGINVSYFVHSAGMLSICPVKMFSADIFEKTYKVNVVSAGLIMKVLCSKKYNSKFLKSAVFISSNVSEFGAKAFGVYGSSKSALDGLMKSMAVELAPSVRVNSVLPGGIQTNMTASLYSNEEMIKRSEMVCPLGKGEVSDIRNAVLFLLSEKAKWITGQQLIVDGGRTVNISG